jgi:DNA helicase-2/ATP-dependent DNA helicase PcrA
VAEAVSQPSMDPRQVAVLYRTNAQARQIEEALRLHNVAYVVLGGIKFYARKEIKDLVAYLRLLVNPADGEALRRVINVPPRGLGAQTVGQLEEYAELRGAPLIDMVRAAEQDTTFGPRARAALGEFVHLLDDLGLKARQEKEIAPIVEAVIARTNYREHVEKADDKDARARLEVVNEFVASCQQYDAEGPRGLEEYLQDMALVADVDAWDPDQPAVTLMTCHSAKGLEFDHVYLLGLEEGLLPHGSTFEEPEAIEEERRLCYVAMTRARKTLTLCYARKRMLYGETTRRDASRFVEEIPASALRRINLEEDEDEIQEEVPARSSHAPPKRSTVARPEPPRAESGAMTTGTKVRHAKFGVGTVLYTSGSGKKQKARIRFESGRPRDFIIAMAPLEILEGK